MTSMNQDVVAGKWKQSAGKLKQKWAKLTDNEILASNGRAEELAGLVQERYGKTKAEATKEVNAALKECGCS
jgi:uncharacterized protein YjbJ (UPF0337 family)